MIAQLDTKTVYSFMESMISIQKYVDQGKAYGYSALGIMDIDNLYGAYYFIKECQKQGIQPLLGLEVTVHHKEELINLRFLALSNRGYRNLMKLSSQKMTGKKEWTDFSPYLEDVCVIVPYFQEIVNLDLGHDYYIGVYPDTAQSNFSHPILPLYRANSFESEDLETLQMLKAIKENVTLREVYVQSQQGLFLPAHRLEQVFQEKFPQALENLSELIGATTYEIDSSLKLPRFNPERPAVEELRERSRNGLQAKGLLSQPYLTRLEEELSVIHDMGFDDYFLVVWDLLRFGRSQGYYMGMGRGSAVGSLVAYALDITGIDPVAKNLIFERFLNRERYTMPDIDIDIPDIYRPEFIRYVRDRYGSIHAAQIVTYSTFGAKQAIRDVFKRYGVPEYELTSITKKIGFKDTLTSAYEGNLGFRQLIQGKIEYQKAFGVVISDKNLTDYIPLKYGEDMLITQYDAHGVEGNGLLKMDFLGLRNLTFAQKMQELLFETQGIQLRIEEIDLEDRATLVLFAAGKTKGIFQFEQPGAIRLLKRVKPESFEEVVATTSLNRPGASDYIDNFVARKHGKEKVTVLDPVLEDILAPTYGIMLYQEQVMQVAQRYAGFSLGKADILRRAMGKKNAAEMHRMEESFIRGALEKGHGAEQAQQVFAVMEKFAGYGFNRSHAYAYAALAFQLAYFKTHYPAIFYQVMLNYASGDYILDALEMGFELAPSSINTVPFQDKLAEKTVHLGLKSIKGMPRDFAYWILDNRPFTSVEDFVTRLPKNYQKLSLLTPLVEIGLFDSFEKNRQKILSNLPTLFIFVEELGSLFADNSYNWLESEDFTQVEKFRKEQEWLGVGISPHPLLILSKNPLYPIVSLSELFEGQTATVLVEIQSIRVIRTKKGENMAFLKVSDSKTKLEVTVFSDQYRQFKNLLHEGRFYYLNGKVQARDGRLQLVLNNLKEAVSERFWIQAADHEHDTEIYHILEQYKGEIPVIIRYENEQKNVLLPSYFVAKDVSLQESLSLIVMKTIYR